MNRRAHRVDPKLLEFARRMRAEPAPAEQELWACLRNRQLGGFKFRRQYACGPYIADFCCPELNMIIELDGDSHEDRVEHDQARTVFLGQHGFEVIRFLNPDVFENIEGVLSQILETCELRQTAPLESRAPHPASPPRTGERC